jgi:hypothetical protein
MQCERRTSRYAGGYHDLARFFRERMHAPNDPLDRCASSQRAQRNESPCAASSMRIAVTAIAFHKRS